MRLPFTVKLNPLPAEDESDMNLSVNELLLEA